MAEGDAYISFASLPVPLSFSSPTRVLAAFSVDAVLATVSAAEALALEGAHVVGMIAYEAAPAFEPAMRVPVRAPGTPTPLAWFAAYAAPSSPTTPSEPCAMCAAVSRAAAFSADAWTLAATRAEYDAAVAAVRAAIRDGEVYQVNYTARLRAARAAATINTSTCVACGEPCEIAFFEALVAAQGRGLGYGARLHLGSGGHVLSASPELFFHWDRAAKSLITRPMKGTARRGLSTASDEAARAKLLASEKERAENLMIVDLIRNDLGRLAAPGSVRVRALFDAEPYPTVWQLTSTVVATPRPRTSLVDVLRALFPCGSVTGAPKIAAMRLIAELESAPRGVYCGAILYLSPGESGTVTASVPIRTVVADAVGRAQYGVGGGITWDSSPEGEWDELWAKAEVLRAAARSRDAVDSVQSVASLLTSQPTYSLFETLRLHAGALVLRSEHVARLRASARFLRFQMDENAVADALDRAVASAFASSLADDARVRLVLEPSGVVFAEALPLAPPFNEPSTFLTAPTAAMCSIAPKRVLFSQRAAVSSVDARLYHKTSDRRVYEAPRSHTLAAASSPDGVFDVLLFNEDDAPTEFVVGNLVCDVPGKGLLTPRLESGVLPGVLRSRLIEDGVVREFPLTRSDLEPPVVLWLINSLRGWVRVHQREG